MNSENKKTILLVEDEVIIAMSGKIDFPYNIPESGRSDWFTDTRAPLRNVKGEIYRCDRNG